MFFSAGSRVYAVDPKTESPFDRADGGSVRPNPRGSRRGRRNGVQIPAGQPQAADSPYVGLMNCHAIALDEKNGQAGMGQVTERLFAENAARNCGDSHLRQRSDFEHYNNERFVGRAIALDAKDGHELWHFDTIPGPGEPGHETRSTTNDAWKMGGGNILGTCSGSPARARLLRHRKCGPHSWRRKTPGE